MGKVKDTLYELGEFERVWEKLGMWQKVEFLKAVRNANIKIQDFEKKKIS